MRGLEGKNILPLKLGIDITCTAQLLHGTCIQLLALGELKDLAEARKVIAVSEDPKFYEPQNAAAYDEAYSRFEALLSGGYI